MKLRKSKQYFCPTSPPYLLGGGRVGEAQARILKDTSCMISLHLLLHTTYTHAYFDCRPGRCGPSSSILSFVSCAPSIFRTLQLHPRSPPSNSDSYVSCPFLPPRVIKSKIRLLSPNYLIN